MITLVPVLVSSWYPVSLFLEIVCGHSGVTLHAFVNRLSRHYFSIFQVNTISDLVTLEFNLRHASGDKIARGEGEGGGGVCMVFDMFRNGPV